MANPSKAVPENAPGAFFVDSTCIDCDTCRQLAPAVFGEAADYAFVRRQPTSAEDRRRPRAPGGGPRGRGAAPPRPRLPARPAPRPPGGPRRAALPPAVSVSRRPPVVGPPRAAAGSVVRLLLGLLAAADRIDAAAGRI